MTNPDLQLWPADALIEALAAAPELNASVDYFVVVLKQTFAAKAAAWASPAQHTGGGKAGGGGSDALHTVIASLHPKHRGAHYMFLTFGLHLLRVSGKGAILTIGRYSCDYWAASVEGGWERSLAIATYCYNYGQRLCGFRVSLRL
jgi:hypothetical protein